MRDVSTSMSTSYVSATVCVRYVWDKQGGHDTAVVLVDATVTGYGQGRFAYFYLVGIRIALELGLEHAEMDGLSFHDHVRLADSTLH